jgi:hypothetical protein
MSCGNRSTEEEVTDSLPNLEFSDAQTSIMKHFSGIIDSVPVAMQMVIASDSSIRGTYFYKKYKGLLPFKGQIARDGRVMLTVYNIQLEEVEYFKGRMNSDWTFNGKWFKVEAGADKRDFELKVIPEEEKEEEIVENLAGTYLFSSKSTEQKLNIRAVTSKQFEFQMMVAEGGCTGEIETGIAYFEAGGDANFYGEEGCYISFKMRNNKIFIKETDCNYYHGMRCTFDGSYKKTSNQVDWITDFYAIDEELDSLLDF